MALVGAAVGAVYSRAGTEGVTKNGLIHSCMPRSDVPQDAEYTAFVGEVFGLILRYGMLDVEEAMLHLSGTEYVTSHHAENVYHVCAQEKLVMSGAGNASGF